MAKQQLLLDLPGFCIYPGPAPEPTVEIDGVMSLLAWQERGFDDLLGQTRRILTAPTGSGKSTLIKALAAVELAAHSDRKVVIAVPQVIIGASFGALRDQCNTVTSLRVKGRVHDWEVGVSLLDVADPVKKLMAFLAAPPGETPASRVAVCTHATLVSAQKRIAKAAAKKSPWEGVSLYVDEAHHAQCSEEEDEAMSNRLGQLVAHWLDHDLGNLLLATATWLRPNLGAIVPPERMGAFRPFSMKMEEHLALIQVGITFRFIVGKPEEALRSIFREGDDKTIVYLPNAATREVKARGKHAVLQGYLDAIGPEKRADAWSTTLRCKGKKARDVRVVDMVTVEGRDERRSLFLKAIDDGSCPDVMFALNLGKEGFDWPALVRAVVIGARASIPDVLQMLGRLLRKYPGKKQVEFTIVLPGVEGEDDAEQVRGYLETIVCSMVIDWHCRSECDVEKAARAARALAGALVNLGGVLPDEPSAAPASDAKPRQHDGRPSQRPTHGDSGDALSILPDSVRAILIDAGIPITAEMVRTICGAMQVLVAKFGFADLAALREALGKRAPWPSEDVVRAFAQGKSLREYDALRSAIGGPYSETCYQVYGKTYQEIRDGRRQGQWPTESEVRAFIQGMSVAEYKKQRSAIAGPVDVLFPIIYGKTFQEIRDGRRNGSAWVSEETVREFAKGKSSEEYDAQRGVIGGPASIGFRKIYGKTFQDVRDGYRLGDAPWPEEDVVRRFIQGKSMIDYDATRTTIGGPTSQGFERVYGKQFGELRDGRRHGEWPAESVVRDFAQGKTAREYDTHRALIGGPVSLNLPRIYGKTFAVLRDSAVAAPTSGAAAE